MAAPARRDTRVLVGASCALLLGLALFTVASRLGRVGTGDVAMVDPTDTFPLGTERPSLAVLRFDGGPDALLAEGFAVDLTLSLAALRGVDVAPGMVALAYDPSRESSGTIAEALDVRHLVTGSVRRHGERLRIVVRLIDGVSGRVAWTDRHDGGADDLFDFHDRTLVGLTDALSLTLSDEERTRLLERGTDDPSAYDELLLGRRAAARLTREASFAAEKHFRRAVEIAPDYARAQALLADTYVLRYENAWSRLPDEDAAKARHHAERALSLDPDLAFAEYVLGRLQSLVPDGDLTAATAHLRRAMRLAPGDDDARVYLAVVLILDGRAEEALAILDDVIAGHPAPPFFYHLSHGHALFALGRAEAAAEALQRCLWQMPTVPLCLRFRIAALGAAGQADEALWAAAEYETLGYRATVSDIMRSMFNRDAATRDRIRDALRAAGLPEGA